VVGEADSVYRLAARMSAYYVIAIVIAVGAIVLTAIGLTREDFPPSPGAARVLMLGTLVLVGAGVVALLATTKREHPREEAAHAAAEKKAEEPGAAKPGGGGEAVPVVESEYKVTLPGGEQLEPGPHTFAVQNEGKIDHDLAVEGGGLEEKTPLIGPGKNADLRADLKPGKYKFYCTVPGHEQLGMKTDVTVR
jgi:plastocyanin